MTEAKKINSKEKKISISIDKKTSSENKRVIDLSVKDANGITINKVCVGIFPNF